MLAKAVATEAGANFINISMSSITSKVSICLHYLQLTSSTSNIYINVFDLFFIFYSGLVRGKNMLKLFSP